MPNNGADWRLVCADRHNLDTDMQGPMKLSPTESETSFLPRPRFDQNPKNHQM
jgi:hypothetical protein